MSQETFVVLFSLILAILLLGAMAWGFIRRRRSQAHYGPLPQLPETLAQPRDTAKAQYVTTTTHGDWLDRIVVHSLGFKAGATISAGPDGVLIERTGADPLFIRATALEESTLGSGVAGKFVEKDGLLVLTWNWEQAEGKTHSMDTFLRIRSARDHREIAARTSELAQQNYQSQLHQSRVSGTVRTTQTEQQP